MSDKSPIIPILGGAAGAVVAVVGADKLGINPTYAAWGTTAAGALTALGTSGVVRQVATGVGAAGMCLGALQLISSAKVEAAKKSAAHSADYKKRQADSDGHYVTREELNGALSQLADGTKQAHCDLLTALREEVKRIVVETQHGSDPSLPGATHPTVDHAPPGAMPVKTPAGGVPHEYTLYRGATDDEYMRNAYGDEERNADFDERNASVEDEYTRNAYGFDEERNAYVEDEYARNAYGDEERNADFDERNAYTDEERNAVVDEERNADFEERNDGGDAQYAQMTGGSSM